MLSALMLKPALLDEVRDILEPLDFFAFQHRAVYEAILALDEARESIDVVTLAHELNIGGKLKMIGGTAFLAVLLDATPAVANAVDHARIIHELGVLRRMGGALRELAIVAQAVETRGDVPAFLQRCESEVFSASTSSTARETSSTMREMMIAAAAAFDPNKPRAPRGASTGMRELDELTLGLLPGELWYVAARPGQGKTALALGIAAGVANTARHALFFSMEMKRSELQERMLSAESGVPFKQLQKRELSHEHWGQVTIALDRLSHLPMIVDDASLLTPSRLRSRVRRHASALRGADPHGRLALVVVDYVQLMAADNPSGNRNDELERISRALKMLAGEFECTVLALSQLSRPGQKGSTTRPTLSDLRGSGALEQDADKVLFIHRDDESEGEERGEAELILGKGRNSGTGKVGVLWEPWCVRFREAKQGGFDFGPTNYD